MTKIKFEYPTTSPTTTIEFTSGLEILPPTWDASIGVPTKETQDGTIYAYEKGIVKETISLKIDLMNLSERNSLITFIQDIVEGSFRVFRYTDQDNNTHDVRFMNEEFDFGDGTFPYSVSLVLREE